MKMKQIILMIIVGSIWVYLGGCSTKQAALKTYTLSAPNDVKKISNSRFKNQTIQVTYSQSLKEKVSQKMRYTYMDLVQENYQNSQWSNSIGKLLQGIFIQVLERSRLYKGVVSSTSAAHTDYRLESTLFEFSHRIRGEESHAVVSVLFSLLSTDSGKLLKSKRFSYKVATKITNAKGYVEATNEAIERLGRDLIEWLR